MAETMRKNILIPNCASIPQVRVGAEFVYIEQKGWTSKPTKFTCNKIKPREIEITPSLDIKKVSVKGCEGCLFHTTI
jgi:hypothetical protein